MASARCYKLVITLLFLSGFATPGIARPILDNPDSGEAADAAFGNLDTEEYQLWRELLQASPTYSLRSNHKGCYVDNVNARTLPYGAPFNTDSSHLTTIESCIALCANQGYLYAGLQYAYQCFCGNTLPPTRVSDTDDRQACGAPCRGDRTEMCGGTSRNSVYSTVPVPVCQPTLALAAGCTGGVLSVPTPTGADAFDTTKSALPGTGTTLNLVLTNVTSQPTTLGVGAYTYYSTATRTVGTASETGGPCWGTITVLPAPVPKPSCTDVTFPALYGCGCPVPAAADVYPDGSSYSLKLLVGGPNLRTFLSAGTVYPYSLTASDTCAQTSDVCQGTITVQDTELLSSDFIDCPFLPSIVQSNNGVASGTYRATYRNGTTKANGCNVAASFLTPAGGSTVTCDRCNKPGVQVVPACAGKVAGSLLSVTDTAAPGDYISWFVQATDGPTSVIKKCGVCVEDPKGGVCDPNWKAGSPAPCPAA